MSKHTKGPWRIVEGRTHGSLEVFAGETALAEIWRRGNKTLEVANARRIVACINACEGFSIEELEGADLFKDSIESDAEIIALRQQRDELLEVLKQAHRFLRKNGYDMTGIDAAIAKAEDAV